MINADTPCPDRCFTCPDNPRLIDTGDPAADFVLVGGYPDAWSRSNLRAWDGPAGHIVRHILDRSDYPTDQRLYCPYATLPRCCEVPMDAAPPLANAEACGARLAEALQTHPRNIIVACDTFALRALTGRPYRDIAAVRGLTFPHPSGARIVPIMPPAAVLRTPTAYRALHRELAYAVGLYRGAVAPRDPGRTRYEIVTAATLPAVAEDLARRPTLAADIETTGLNPLTDRVLSLGMAAEPNQVFIFPAALLPKLGALFAAAEPKWVWHNGKFDTKFLRQLGLPARADEDTMLQSYVLNESRGGHDLKTLARVELGAEDYEAALRPYLARTRARPQPTYADIPADVLYQYQARDCDYTLQLFHRLSPRVRREPDLARLYREVLLPAAAFLQRVEDRGIYVDKAHVGALRAELTARIARANDAISEAVADIWDADDYVARTGARARPDRFNPDSWRQLNWLLYQRLGLKPAQGFPPNTAAETLATVRPAHPLVAAVLELRGAQKLLGTYVEGIIANCDADGRVRSTFNLHGTETGRLSSTGPNVQNIPRDKAIKRIFAASPGRALLELDYSGQELRVLAALSGDDFFREVFRAGRDPHGEVAAAMFGPDYTSEQRTRAKGVNFGIAYGRTEYGLAKEFGIPVPEAKAMIDAWFARCPQAAAYLRRCQEEAVTRGRLTTPFGRRRRIHLITDERHKQRVRNEGANFIIQSVASDLTLLASMALDPLVGAHGARVVNLIHDAVLLEVPDDPTALAEVARIAAEAMVDIPRQHLGDAVPFAVEAKAGPNWGDLQPLDLSSS